MNEEQVLETFRKAICGSVSLRKVPGTALNLISTPIQDKDGVPVSVFVNGDGLVTDGGAVSANLRSMRAANTFMQWPLREAFLKSRGMSLDRGELVLEKLDADTPERTLAYLNGIAHLPSYFEVKPLAGESDKFRDKVTVEVTPLLERLAPPRGRYAWVKKRLHRQGWEFKGIPFETDLTPEKSNVMVQVISHENQDAADKRVHVASKLMPYTFGKGSNKKLELVAVVPKLSSYPPALRKLITTEAKETLQWTRVQDRERLAQVLTQRRRTERPLG